MFSLMFLLDSGQFIKNGIIIIIKMLMSFIFMIYIGKMLKIFRFSGDQTSSFVLVMAGNL